MGMPQWQGAATPTGANRDLGMWLREDITGTESLGLSYNSLPSQVPQHQEVIGEAGVLHAEMYRELEALELTLAKERHNLASLADAKSAGEVAHARDVAM